MREPNRRGSLDPARIRLHLPGGSMIGSDVLVLEEVGSTNDEAHALAQRGAAEGSVVFAEMQRKGRGRRGAGWFSIPGNDLLFSVLLRPQGEPESWRWLSQGAAVAVCRVLEAILQVPAAIKWPNDVCLQGGRKVCGILLETRGGRSSPHAVLGIGLNVNGREFPVALSASATSMQLAGGREWDREILAGCLLGELDVVYHEGVMNRRAVLGEAENRSIFPGDRVISLLSDDGGEIRGRFRGLGACGELVLECEGGTRREIVSAHQVRIEA